MTASYAELEIALHRELTLREITPREIDVGYQVELRFSNPLSDAALPPARGHAALNPEKLLPHAHDPVAYGRELSAQLFSDDSVRELYGQALAASQSASLNLRLRVLAGKSVPELHALRWELLQDPESERPLSTSEKTPFSRFMLSNDWRPVRLRPRKDLRSLVAVAAPSDVTEYNLAAVDGPGEAGRVQTALADIESHVVGLDEALTLKTFVTRVREGFDIVYLVCHGALHHKTGEPRLFLQKDDGSVGVVNGRDVAQRFAEMEEPPRLVVLASCESAGTEDGPTGAQTALAVHLAEAGVPAIIAMQGQVSMATVEGMMPVLFRELLKDGQIDRALAVARGEIRDRSDHWMPALFLRLKSGRIWYDAGFSGDDDPFKKWNSIVSNVRRGQFVPILGPVLDERIRGARGTIAQALAERHGFPLAVHQARDLAKVAQFLSVKESRRFTSTEILRELRRQLITRYPDLKDDADDLKELFKGVVKHRAENDDDPFRILAELGSSLYVCSSFDPILPLTLAESGAKPRPLFGQWRKSRDDHPKEPAYQGTPDRENPVVHFPFGFIAKPDSLVLTEDDYIDYLIAAVDYKLMPRVVRGTLVESSLLFLGFDLDDWAFRILFRLIMSLDGSAQLADFSHVGVQVDPSENRFQDVDEARAYLEAYLSSGRDAPRIDIYWGTATDFLLELRQQVQKAHKETTITLNPDDEDEDDWISF